MVPRPDEKPPLTCTDAHALVRSVTAEGGVQVLLRHKRLPARLGLHRDRAGGVVPQADAELLVQLPPELPLVAVALGAWRAAPAQRERGVVIWWPAILGRAKGTPWRYDVRI